MSNFSILRNKFLPHSSRIKNITTVNKQFPNTIIVYPFVTKSGIPLYHEVDENDYVLDIPSFEPEIQKPNTPLRKSEYPQTLRIRNISQPVFSR